LEPTKVSTDGLNWAIGELPHRTRGARITSGVFSQHNAQSCDFGDTSVAILKVNKHILATGVINGHF
jgi:hypothetical protein